MLKIIVLIAIVYFVVVFLTDNSVDDRDFIDEDYMENDDYELLFKSYIYEIDPREPLWVENALRELKRGHKYYTDNTRALSTLMLLEDAANGNDPQMVQFLLACSKYRKKGMLGLL